MGSSTFSDGKRSRMQDGRSVWPLQGPIIELTKHTATCTAPEKNTCNRTLQMPCHTQNFFWHIRAFTLKKFKDNCFTCEPLWTQNCGGRIGNRNFTGKTERNVQGILVSWRFVSEKILLDRFLISRKAARKRGMLALKNIVVRPAKMIHFRIIMFAAKKCRVFSFQMKQFLALEPSLSSELNDCSCLHNQGFLAHRRVFRHGFQRPARFWSFNYFICLVRQSGGPWYFNRSTFFRNAPWMFQ